MSKSTFWTIVAGFLFCGFLVYASSLGNGFVRWDDGLLIYENPAIWGITFANLKTIFSSYDPELYIPLTLLSYQIDFSIAGTNASWYHFHSLILHCLSAILVCLLARRITGSTFASVLTGLLFLVHPLNTEAVAWASGRKDVLSTVFLLGSLLTYDYWREVAKQKHYILSILMLLLGLLSKPTLIVAPVLFVLLDYVQKRSIPWKKLLPHTLLAIVFAIVAVFGKTGVLESAPLIDLVLIAPLSTCFYLFKMIVPYGLSPIYPFLGDVELLSLRIAIPLLVCAAITVIAVKTIHKSRTAFFGLGFFAVTLAPSFLNVSKGDAYYFASDRYVYTASIGLFLLVAVAFSHLKRRVETLQGDRVLNIGLIVVLITLSVLAHKQSLLWKDTETLLGHNVNHYPGSYVIHNNLGNVYRNRGELERSANAYKEALALSELHGRGSTSHISQSKILSNLASAQRTMGETESAAQSIADAEKRNPQNPHAKLQKGLLALSNNDAKGAEASYKQALEIAPTLTSAQINLGSLYVSLGRIDDAVAVLEQATEQNPFYPQAFYNLGVSYRKLQRNREAKEAYEKAVELEPSFVAARINLGILYAERRDIEEAIEQFEAALKYDPSNARAVSALQQLGATGR